MKRIGPSIFLLAASLNLLSQGFSISTGTNTIDFQAFDGSGFASVPSVGQLDSDEWAITGFSNGDLAFGGTQTTTNTDFTRGDSDGGETSGGIYSFDTDESGGSGNIIFGVQPGGSDFTPGTMTLRIQNNTGITITDLTLSYNIYVLNNAGRSSSVNFSHDADDIGTYTALGALDYTTTATADVTPAWTSVPRSTTISSLSIADGANYYLRWESDDVGGSGTRDEFGIDDITITSGVPPTVSTFIPTSGNEGTIVTITGSGFSNGTGTSSVRFNGSASSFTVISDTEIEARVPISASDGQLSVVTDDVEGFSSGSFTILLNDNSGCTATLSDLIISEYIEGSSNNKAIEIFNGTGSSVDLSDYSVELYANGSLTATTTLALSGTLTDGAVYVIGNGSAGTEISTASDITSGIASFNGNDALVLRSDISSNVIDAIGQVGSSSMFAADVTLQRKNTIVAGDTDETDVFTVSDEWDSFAQDTFTGLGSHAVTGDPLAIDTEPDSQCADASGGATNVNFSTSSAGASFFQWRKWNGTTWIDVDGTTDGTGVHSGFSTSTLTVSVTESGDGARYQDQYYCEVGTSATCYSNSNVVYVLDGSTGCEEPLPVQLLEFSGFVEGSECKLSWSTATELNNSGFYVQKSSDGLNFESIGFVSGRGNSNSLSSYVFSDPSFLNSTFYQLEQVDFDGTSTKSKIILVASDFQSLKLYPNPFHNQIHIGGISDQQIVEYSLIYPDGKILTGAVKKSLLEAKLENLSSGLYQLRFGGKTFSIIKQ